MKKREYDMQKSAPPIQSWQGPQNMSHEFNQIPPQQQIPVEQPAQAPIPQPLMSMQQTQLPVQPANLPPLQSASQRTSAGIIPDLAQNGQNQAFGNAEG
mmetsp:Transcript_13417/g.15066  ORF Transcript_13417/g.15066 Transcript_13417/m.15066 type:complete len:99 (+) Transcript_13417:899-1195(+)